MRFTILSVPTAFTRRGYAAVVIESDKDGRESVFDVCMFYGHDGRVVRSNAARFARETVDSDGRNLRRPNNPQLPCSLRGRVTLNQESVE